MYEKIAENIARKEHKDQKRWSGEPYITHPEAIVKQLRSEKWCFINLDYLFATAWLHDVIENCNITVGDLLGAKIPDEIIESLLAISKVDNEDYLNYILRVSNNEIARIVKIADITHNLSTIGDGKKDRKDKYKLAIYILTKE